jgi:perosamine synthetase
LGGSLHGEAVGRFGRAAVFGFYPNKQITTGEGGMIVTDDDRLAKTCAALRNHGRPADGGGESPTLGQAMNHLAMGWNYRMTEMSAALGRSQLRRLDALVAAREEVAMQYTTRLAAHPDLVIPTFQSGVRMSWFAFVIRLSDRFTADDRDEILTGIRRHDIGVAAYFPAIPLLDFYRRLFGHTPGDFPMAESVAARTIALPFFPSITEREVDLVCQTLEVMMTRSVFSRE